MSKYEKPTQGRHGGPVTLKPTTRPQPIRHGSPAPITKKKGG